MAPGRNDVPRKLRCLLCLGQERKLKGCSLRHIQDHFLYKKYSCQDCSYRCSTENTSMVHSWNNGHRMEQCENEYLEMLSSSIFRDCLRAADHGMESVLSAMREQHHNTSRTVVSEKSDGDVVEVNAAPGGSKERNKDLDKDTDVQAVPDSTVLPDSTPTAEHELNSSHVSQIDVNMKSEKTTKVSCRKCVKSVTNDFLHRRRHVLRDHFKAGSDQDSDEVLTSAMRACFPGSTIFSDLQCNECGKSYKSESGRKLHTIQYHMDRMVKCVIHGCTVQERSPAELKVHIQNDHRMVVSREVNTNVFRRFLCAKKEFDAELAPVVLRCFPINLRANSSSVSSAAGPVGGVADAISKVVGNVSSTTTPRIAIQRHTAQTMTSSSSSDDSGSERYEQALRSRALREPEERNATAPTASQYAPPISPANPPLTKRKTLLPTSAIPALDRRSPASSTPRTRSPPRPHSPPRTRPRSRSPTTTHMFNDSRYPSHMSSHAGYASNWSCPQPVERRMYDDDRFSARRRPYESAERAGRSFPLSSRREEPRGARSLSNPRKKILHVKCRRKSEYEQRPIKGPKEERSLSNTREKIVNKQGCRQSEYGKKTGGNLQKLGTVKRAVPPETRRPSWAGKRKKLDSDSEPENVGRPIKQEV